MKCETCGGPLMGDYFEHKPGCFMSKPEVSAPLDLDAIEDEMAGAGCLRPRTAAALIAEVERLRAENERHQKANLVRAVLRHAEGLDLQMWVSEAINAEDFDRVPWLVAESLGKENERLRAGSVPRSSLVQVGWLHDGETLTGWRADDTDRCQPVYVIREDADA